LSANEGLSLLDAPGYRPPPKNTGAIYIV
jgi:hypothetical protein